MIQRPDDLWNAEFEVRPGAPGIVPSRLYPQLHDLGLINPGTGIYPANWNRYDPQIKVGQSFWTTTAGNFYYKPTNGVGISVDAWLSIEGKLGSAGTIYIICPEQHAVALDVPNTYLDDPNATSTNLEWKLSYYMENVLYDCDRLRFSLRLAIGGGGVDFFYINPYPAFFTHEGPVLSGTMTAPPP